MQKRGATRSQQTKTRFPFLCHFSATITVVNVFPKCAVDYVGWTLHVARETLKILKMQIIIYSKVWKVERKHKNLRLSNFTAGRLQRRSTKYLTNIDCVHPIRQIVSKLSKYMHYSRSLNFKRTKKAGKVQIFATKYIFTYSTFSRLAWDKN